MQAFVSRGALMAVRIVRRSFVPPAVMALVTVIGLLLCAPVAAARQVAPAGQRGSGSDGNTMDENSLNSVSCVGTAFCEAVGTFYSPTFGGLTGVLAEGWDGSAWTVQSAPDTAYYNNSAFGDVSCTLVSSCTAVGSSNPSDGLAADWDGTSWSAETISAAALNLNGVSCVPGASFCMAVGSELGGRFGPVSLVWNGSSWTSEPVASPGQYLNASLKRVSCLSPTFCVAVGGWAGPVTDENLAEIWDGTSWTVMDTPQTGQGSVLSSVACSSEDWCIATVQGGAITETWDGSTWSVEPIAAPSGTTGAYLAAVWCASSTSCVAVGADSVGTKRSGLAETWDGNAWSVSSTTNPTYYSIALQALSCSAITSCVAVGQYQAKKRSATTGISEILGPAGWSAEPTPPVTPVAVTPDSGPPKQAVGISLFGFAPGTTVTVAYHVSTTSDTAGWPAPARSNSSPRIRLCRGPVAADGSFSCDAQIPKASDAGQGGAHEISASGGGLNSSTTFTLT